jgi:hypothetical protein
MQLSNPLPLHDFPDRAIRRLLENPANLRDLVTAVAPDLAPHLDFDHAEPVDRAFLMEDWRRREADLLFRVPFHKWGEETPTLVCVLIEHQSAPDPRMPLRMLVYAVLYWEREWKTWEEGHPPGQALRLTPLLPIVFHTGGERWRTFREFGELLGGPEEMRPYAPRWRTLFWDLAERSPEELLDSAGIWLQALAVVRAERAGSEEFQPLYEAVLRRLEGLLGREEMRRHELLWFILSWALLRRPGAERERLLEIARAAQRDAGHLREVEQMSQTVWKSAQEELEEEITARVTARVTERVTARVTEQVTAELEERERQRIEARELAEARARELAEARARELAEARARELAETSAREREVETLRALLRDLLEEQFGPPSEETLRRIRGVDGTDRLRSLIRQSVRVRSVEELDW